MSTIRFASAFVALTLGAAACTSGDGDQSTTPTTDLNGNEILLTSALETVDNCDALLARLKIEGLEQVGPYGFNGRFGGPIAFGEDVDFAMEDSADDAMADGDASFDTATAAPAEVAATNEAGSDGGGRSANEFSETNNQEEGVDEADLVKTDGRLLVTINGNRLRVVNVEDEPRLVNTIKLPDEFYGGELFLHGDTALLMTSGWTNTPFIAERGIATDWYPGSPTGRIMEIDLDKGSVERTLEFEGGYLSAREIDGTIRIVMSATANRFSFLLPSNQGAEAAAEAANRKLIEDSTIDMWVPTYRITEGSETVTEGPVVDCNQVHLPTEFAGFGSLVVLTTDIEDGLNVKDSLSVFTDGQTVYASQDRLAVATPRWPEYDNNGEPIGDDGYRTAIHTFDISNAQETDYAASGSVRGTLLSQFSMSEHEGYLRVATTDGTPWDSRNSESFVTVLSENGQDLTEVGQVGGLGEGERIFAVRFMGDMGYVVTFEQIDPLYTVDLSDPANPEVKGELKIPGVSDYLHPYGEFLLAVGRDGDENGLNGGAVVSVFDVSDPSNPTQVTKVPLGPETTSDRDWVDSYSPVSGDPKAFNIWGDTIIVPVAWWSYSESADFVEESNSSIASLIRVGDDGQLTKVGEVSHPKISECEGGFYPAEGETLPEQPLTEEEQAELEAEEEAASEASSGSSSGSTDAEADFVDDEDVPADEEAPPALEIAPRPDGPEQFCWSYQPDIRRTVIVGDNIYSISDAGIGVHTFDGLDEVSWIPFER